MVSADCIKKDHALVTTDVLKQAPVTNGSYFCTLYGLSVASVIPFFSAPVSAPTKVDVVVRYGRVSSLPASDEITAAGANYRVASRGILLFWEGIGTFLVQNGREITVNPSPGADERVLRKMILTDVFAALLHQRGFLTLHASAAAIDGEAVIFLGKSGRGKSTLALALHARGHQLVADDVVAVKLDGPSPVVPPAYPEINLWPDTLAALSHDPATLSTCTPYSVKRAFPVRQQFPDADVPLKYLCVLDPAAESALKRLSRRESLAALLDNSYCFRLLAEEEIVTHLSRCARVAASTTTLRARTCRSLESLPALVHLIEDAVKIRW